jgi:hypothetical protein
MDQIRLLGFNRVPPTVGRIFDIETELWQNADPDLAKTFYKTSGNLRSIKYLNHKLIC